MNEDTYVVIPVYNEAEVIGDVVRSVRRHFANLVCVDDGSHDGSAGVVTGVPGLAGSYDRVRVGDLDEDRKVVCDEQHAQLKFRREIA